MDVERTIQFLLEHQAAAEAEMAEIRAVLQENAAQHAKTIRRLDAFGKIVQTGTKMLVKMERDTNHKIELLTRKVDRLTDFFPSPSLVTMA